MDNAILYLRVSSDKQLKNYSLPVQEQKGRDWCEKNDATVHKIFVDRGESARAADRKEFQNMLAFCKKHRGQHKYVVVSDLSRFARNIQDQTVAIADLQAVGVQLISIDELTDDSASGKLMRNMIGAYNQYFSDSLSEKTQYRMHEGLKAGRWMWKGPLGFLSVNKKLVHDPERAPLIRKGFEMVASGLHPTTDSVLKQLNALGLTTLKGHHVTKQTFQRILNNEIYAGWLKSGSLRVKGQHVPIVSEELFAQVQQRINKRSVDHKPVNESFPLKGMVICWKCGKLITAAHVRGRSNTYQRYWCYTKGCGGVACSKADLERHFVNLLGMIVQPSAELIANLPSLAATQWATRKEQMAAEAAALSKRLQEQNDLSARAVKAKIKGEISQTDYEGFKASVDAEVQQIQTQIAHLDQTTVGIKELMAQTEQEAVNFAMFWKEAGLNQRLELQKALFPHGLFFSPKNLFFEPRNTQLFEEFNAMLDDLKTLASPTGFEPVLSP
jgi:site-specific DNA recombinase